MTDLGPPHLTQHEMASLIGIVDGAIRCMEVFCIDVGQAQRLQRRCMDLLPYTHKQTNPICEAVRD